MNEQHIKLDVSKKPDGMQVVYIGQGDVHGTTIVADLYENGTALDMTGKTARIVVRLPDGIHYVRDANVTVSGSAATYVVDESHLALVPKRTESAYFEVVQGSSVIASTQRFAIEVLRSALDGTEQPAGSWDTAVDEAIDAANAAASAANTAAANADATADGVESRVQQMAQDAAETATADAEQRIQDAIEAMGDISEQAVPVMSADVRGGAKLEEHGGLALRNGALGIGSLVQQSDGYARGGLAEVTAKGHAEQDGTPSPDNPVPIQVVRGRNLLDESLLISGEYIYSDGTVIVTAGWNRTDFIEITAGATYTFNPNSTSGASAKGAWYSDANVASFISSFDSGPITVTAPSNAKYVRLSLRDSSTNIQLELGSTPTPYVPYGHVGMEAQGRNLLDITISSVTRDGITYTKNEDGSLTVRGTTGDSYSQIVIGTISFDAGTYTISKGVDDTSTEFYVQSLMSSRDTTYSRTVSSRIENKSIFFYVAKNTTIDKTFYPMIELGDTAHDYQPYYHETRPIPLPQRGWVAGLPDGTADTLRLDGAGKCEWTLADAETTTAATDGVTGTIGVDVLSTTGQIADGATVLYKLATPVTEDCGYVDMPEISGECRVSIPELDALGIKYFVDDSVTQYGREIYARANSEYEDRLEQLEQTVATLVTQG